MERASPMFYIRDTRSDPSHDWRNAEPSSRKSKHDMLHLQNATVPNLSRRRAAQSLEVPLYMMRMCSLRGNASCEGAMNS
ncbi:hypothetical protein HBI22_165830 [Parastagonospora nodorum]|nr:hypothetical protein HBI22_165830 [Parastagonospora nodorum]